MTFLNLIKTPFILLLFIVLCIETQAQSERSYREIAQGFMQNSFNKELRQCSLPYIASGYIFDDANHAISVVYNLIPQGFIVVATHSCPDPVVAFSTTGVFDFSPKSDNHLLNLIKRDLSQVATHQNGETIPFNQQATPSFTTHVPTAKSYTYQYGPHLNSIWGGVNCYDQFGNSILVGNLYTPNNYSPGCVATATSIVMHYFAWPKTGLGKHTNYDNSGTSQGAYTASFGTTTYNWGNMLNEYYNKLSSVSQRGSMGLLAYHCSIAFDTEYENAGSTSNLSFTPSALDQYFRYISHYETSSWTNFWPRIRENLQNGYPVTLAISSTTNVGHAVVCDGYGYETNQPYYYHLQFGWWGSYNAWYNLQNSWSASGYSAIDGGVLDILPKPAINQPFTFASNPLQFVIPIEVGAHLNWNSFTIYQSYAGGSFTTIATDYTALNFIQTVSNTGLFRFKTQAKVNGVYYSNNYSTITEHLIPRTDSAFVSLVFNGSKSFFVNDNLANQLDVQNNYTLESWVKINSLNTTSDFDIIMDRKGVFSLYLIDDYNGDYAIRYVVRDSNNGIVASLRSDSGSINLAFANWVHVAVSYNGNKASLFLNGKEVNSAVDSNFALPKSTKAINFGARYWNAYERYMIGEMDEIRISNIPRYSTGNQYNPYRINQHVPDNNTQLLLHLDEGSGLALGDAVGHFTGMDLRSSPNNPTWTITQQEIPIIYDLPLNAQMEVDSVILSWVTQKEIGSKGFAIMHASSQNGVWDSIGWVFGANNSNTLVPYQFVDNQPLAGHLNYYRLKHIEHNGRATYSNIVSVLGLNETETNVNPLRIYPNPVNTAIDLTLPLNITDFTLELYDLSGRLILSAANTTTLDVSNLQNGMYHLTLKTKDSQWVEKVQIMH